MSLLPSATYAGTTEPLWLASGGVIPGPVTIEGTLLVDGIGDAIQVPNGSILAAGVRSTSGFRGVSAGVNVAASFPNGLTSASTITSTGLITATGGLTSADTITTSGTGNLELIVAAGQGTYAAPIVFNPGSSSYGALGNKAICQFQPGADVTFTVPVDFPIVTVNNNNGTLANISVFTGEAGATGVFRVQNTSGLLTIPVFISWV